MSTRAWAWISGGIIMTALIASNGPPAEVWGRVGWIIIVWAFVAEVLATGPREGEGGGE